MTLLSSGQQQILVNGTTKSGTAVNDAQVRSTLSLVRPKYFELVHQLQLLMKTKHSHNIDNNFQTLRQLFDGHAAPSEAQKLLEELAERPIVEF